VNNLGNTLEDWEVFATYDNIDYVYLRISAITEDMKVRIRMSKKAGSPENFDNYFIVNGEYVYIKRTGQYLFVTAATEAVYDELKRCVESNGM